LNSSKLKSAQGSVFFVKHKQDESQEDEKVVECILKIVRLSFFNSVIPQYPKNELETFQKETQILNELKT
jgi:hypothetical protein